MEYFIHWSTLALHTADLSQAKLRPVPERKKCCYQLIREVLKLWVSPISSHPYGLHVDRYTTPQTPHRLTERAGRLEYLLVHFLISSLQNQGEHDLVRLTAPSFSFLEKKNNIYLSTYLCVYISNIPDHRPLQLPIQHQPLWNQIKEILGAKDTHSSLGLLSLLHFHKLCSGVSFKLVQW